MQFTVPRVVSDPEQCRFYHSLDFPDGTSVEGDWDLRGRTIEYIGHTDVRGKRVLDVGTASGFLSFEIERMGASEVVSFDADSANRITRVPHWDVDSQAVLRGIGVGLDRLKNGYWYSHAKMRSRAKAFYGDVHAIPAALGSFDIVVVGQILVHIRDQMGALEQCASRCSDILVVSEGMLLANDSPFAQFLPNPDAENQGSWWRMSPTLYRNFLSLMGFEQVTLATAAYPCPVRKKDIDITTMVFRRICPQK